MNSVVADCYHHSVDHSALDVLVIDRSSFSVHFDWVNGAGCSDAMGCESGRDVQRHSDLASVCASVSLGWVNSDECADSVAENETVYASVVGGEVIALATAAVELAIEIRCDGNNDGLASGSVICA